MALSGLLFSGLAAYAAARVIEERCPSQWSPASLFTSLFLIFFFTQAFLRSTYRRLNDPLRDIPRVKFPDRRTAFRARLVHPDPDLLLKTARYAGDSDLVRYTGTGGSDALLMLSPQARREVLSQQAYANFERIAVGRQRLRFTTGNGLLTAEGEDHRFQRKSLHPAFSLQQIRSLAPMIWQKSAELIDALAEHTKAKPDEDVQIYDWVSRAALDIIGVASWGSDFEAIADPQSEVVSSYRKLLRPSLKPWQRILIAMLPIDLAVRLPLAGTRDLREGAATIRETARKAVEERKQNKLENRKDIMSVAMQSGVFTDQQLVETLLTFLSAGHETSATAAMFICLHMARYPEIQERLRAEVREKLPSPSESDDITWDDLDNLEYLRAVCLEAMRLCPPVSGLQRVAIHDTIVCGRVIPKGTEFVSNLWVNGKLDWDNPDEFDPERWLGENSDRLRGGSTGEFQFSPFSHGNRHCIGQAFARLELLSLVAALVGRFDMSIEDKSMPPVTLGIVAVPVQPVRLRMKPVYGW